MNYQIKDSVPLRAREESPNYSNFQNDFKIASDNSASGGAAQNSDNDDYVTQEWLDKYASSSDPDYQNLQQPKDFSKDYDKPVSDSKGKVFLKQLSYSADSGGHGAVSESTESHLKRGSYRPPLLPDQPSTQHTDSSCKFVSGSGVKEDQTHSPTCSRNCQSDAPSANPPALSSARYSTKLTQDSKSKTSPIVSAKNAPSDRPHTSPQSSLESHEYNQPSPPTQQSSHQPTHQGKGQEGRVGGGRHDKISQMNRPDALSVNHPGLHSAEPSPTSKP